MLFTVRLGHHLHKIHLVSHTTLICCLLLTHYVAVIDHLLVVLVVHVIRILRTHLLLLFLGHVLVLHVGGHLGLIVHVRHPLDLLDTE